MSGNRNIRFVRPDAFSNKVTLYEKTLQMHISGRHGDDRIPVTEDHIYNTLVDPDQARRSLDPSIGNQSCLFEKFFSDVQGTMRMAVIYEGVATPADYEAGGKTGHITTSYFIDPPGNSKNVGGIFWTKPPAPVQNAGSKAPPDNADESKADGKSE